MRYKVVYIALAKDDLKKALNYYKGISPKLAKDFLARIAEGKKFISQNPYADDVMYKNFRMHYIKQFPYHIHYQILEDKKHVLIIAVEFSKEKT